MSVAVPSAVATSRTAWVNRRWGILISALLAFMVVFNVTFAALPSPSTLGAVVRGGTVALLWFGASAFRRFAIEEPGSVVLLCALVAYGFLQWTLTGFSDASQVIRLFAFGLYGIYGALLLATLFEGDEHAFARSCAVAGVIQAAFIIFSFISRDYRTWLSGIVAQSGNIDIVTGLGAPGFSNSSGALLSVSQAGCVFAALFASRVALRRVSRIAYVFAAVVITASTFLAGRTGVLLSCIFLGAFGVEAALRRRWSTVAAGGVAIVAMALVGNVALQIAADRAGVDATLLKSWSLELFTHGTSTASYGDLASQPIPPVSFTTLIGTGLVSASPPWLGSASGNDSGYVQTYYALGLPATIVFYLTVAYLALRSTLRSSAPYLLGVLALGMFLVEAKEPFMFKAPLTIIFFTFSFLRLARREASL